MRELENLGRKLRAFVCLLAGLFILISPLVAADVFKCKNSQGNLEFSDKPCADSSQLIAKIEDSSSRSSSSNSKPENSQQSESPVLGSWLEVATGEALSITADGNFEIIAPQGTAYGKWETVDDGEFALNVSANGRTIECSASVRENELSVICLGKLSVYERI